MARKGFRRFRRRAFNLVAAGISVAEVARLLEISDQSIYAWRRQELVDRLASENGQNQTLREPPPHRGCPVGCRVGLARTRSATRLRAGSTGVRQ